MTETFKHKHAFANSRVSMGVMIHMAGMITGILATDKMKDPSARWAAITAFGVGTGIGETMWRDHIEWQRAQADEQKRRR